MKPSYKDMWLTNQNPTVSPQLYIYQNKQNKRRPKFIVSNTKVTYPKIPKVNIVSPVQQALIKIKDFKKSLFQDIFPVPNVQVSQDYSSTIEGTKEIPITGGATKLNLQSNFVNFRPSLSDPLRPNLLQVTAPAPDTQSRLRNFDKFMSPHEFTPIDTAVVGQVPQPQPDNYIRNSEKSKSMPYSLSTLSKIKIRGKLKPPKETTPIDKAIFANDVFTKLTQEPKNSAGNQKYKTAKIKGIFEVSDNIDEKDESYIENKPVQTVIVLKNSKIRTEN